MDNEQALYQIHIKGHLDRRWESWFEGFAFTAQFAPDDTPVTILTGPIVDQAALYGVLTRLRNLGLTLISVQRIDERRMTTPR